MGEVHSSSSECASGSSGQREDHGPVWWKKLSGDVGAAFRTVALEKVVAFVLLLVAVLLATSWRWLLPPGKQRLEVFANGNWVALAQVDPRNPSGHEVRAVDSDGKAIWTYLSEAPVVGWTPGPTQGDTMWAIVSQSSGDVFKTTVLSARGNRLGESLTVEPTIRVTNAGAKGKKDPYLGREPWVLKEVKLVQSEAEGLLLVQILKHQMGAASEVIVGKVGDPTPRAVFRNSGSVYSAHLCGPQLVLRAAANGLDGTAQKPRIAIIEINMRQWLHAGFDVEVDGSLIHLPRQESAAPRISPLPECIPNYWLDENPNSGWSHNIVPAIDANGSLHLATNGNFQLIVSGDNLGIFVGSHTVEEARPHMFNLTGKR